MDAKKLLKRKLFEINPQLAQYEEALNLQEKLDKHRTLVDGLEKLKGDKGEPGQDGKTPVKGKDYFTPQEVDNIVSRAKPVKGKDYFTDEEAIELIKLATPIKGVHYRDGIDGKDSVVPGPQGRPGEDAEPETPESIAEKLNTLKEVIDPKVLKGGIKGLSKQINYNDIQGKPNMADLRWHGGGISKVSVDGVTITGDGTPSNPLVGASGADEKVKYDAADPTAGYLSDKVVAGTGITLAEGTGGDANKLKITNSAPFVDAASDGNTYGRKNGAWSAIVGTSGDVVGPASAVDSNFVAFDTTSGKLIKDSGFSASSFLKLDQTTPQTVSNGFPIFSSGIYSPLLYGSSAANGDITIRGTSSATKTTSYVLLQDAGGLVGIGTATPTSKLDVVDTNFPVGRFARDTLTNAGGTIYGASVIERLMTGGTSTGGTGVGIFFKDPNSAGTSSFAGLIAGSLAITTAGSEIGDVIIGASYHGADPAGNQHLIVRATGASTGNVLIPNGGMSVGTATAPTSTNGGIDIASGGLSLVIGADNGATTRTNLTAKNGRIGGYHYTNAASPVAIMLYNAASTTSTVFIGGGTSTMNAATDVKIYTAANTTTATGTERIRINSTGNVSIGTAADGTALLHLAAGTASAGTAPLKFTTGTLLTAPEAGAMEFLTNTLYFTPTTTRKTVALVEDILATTVPVANTTNGSVGVGTTVARNDHAHPSTIAGSTLSISQDNNGVERKFFKDDFSNNTIAQYTVTGSPTIGSGLLTLNADDQIDKILPTTSTQGVWSMVSTFTAYVQFQTMYLYFGSSSYAILAKNGVDDTINVYLVVNGATLINNVSTTRTLASGTYCRTELKYDGTNYIFTIYGMSGAYTSTTAGSAPTAPEVGCRHRGGSTVTVDELTYLPTISFTDLVGTVTDTETRYMQQQYVAAWSAADAGDVVITTGANGYMTLAGTGGDEAQISTILRSYKFSSGSYKAAFIDNGDGGGTYDYSYLDFCIQDINNKYNVLVYDQVGVGQTVMINKVVAGSSTTIASAVLSGYTKGNKTWIEVQYSRMTGQIWAYVWDNASSKPTTPNVIAYDSTFQYGNFGVRSRVGTAGAGNLSTRWSDLEVRANSIIGETNVPTTETGYYLRDDFDTDSTGRLLIASTNRFAYSAGNSRVQSTGTTTFTNMLPSKVTRIGATVTYEVLVNFLSSGTGVDYCRALIPFLAPNPTDGASTITGGYQVYLASHQTTPASSFIRLYKDGAIIGSATGGITGEGTIYKVKIVADATTINVYMVASDNNWSGSYGAAVITVIDSTYTSGYCGIGAYAADAAADYSIGFNGVILSGTRYYNKPMLRGGQIGEYYNGTASVSSTRFTDGYNWNTSGEYGGDTIGVGTESFFIDTTNGFVRNKTNTASISTTVNSIKLGNGTYEMYWMPVTAGADGFCRTSMILASQTQITGYPVTVGNNCYTVQVRQDSGHILIYKDNVNLVDFVYGTMTLGVLYKIKVEFTSPVINVYFARVNDAYPTTPTTTYSDSTYTNGYFGIGSGFSTNATGLEWRVYGLNINALGTVTTSMPMFSGVPHGARYDTQEEVYTTLVNPDQYGEYSLATALKTTNFASEDLEMYFANTTNSTSINGDGLTTLDTPLTDANWTNYLAPILLRDQDIADTLRFSMRRKNFSGVTYDNQPANYVKYLALAPIWRV